MTQNKKQRIIGVTGIIGSGTSTVSAILQEKYGAHVICADTISRDVMEPGELGYVKAVISFGEGILDLSGYINRKRLGKMVFEKPSMLRALENIIHPIVALRTKKQAEGKPFVVIDAPLLVESGLNAMCNDVWLVSASNDIRLTRILQRDGLTEDEAMARINSRKGDDYLRIHATQVLQNTGSVTDLEQQVKDLMEST